MLNKCAFIGTVGRQPEIRNLQGGSKLASFSLAVSERWKDKSTGERKEKTEWVPVVVFDENLTKVVEQYVGKGSKLYVEGKFATRKWTDKDGHEKYTTEIVLQKFNGQIVMLDSKKKESTEAPGWGDESTPSQSAGKVVQADLDDEIPF